MEILLCLAPYPLPGILPRVTFSKCLRGLGLSGDLDPFGVSLGFLSAMCPVPLLWESRRAGG